MTSTKHAPQLMLLEVHLVRARQLQSEGDWLAQFQGKATGYSKH